MTREQFEKAIMGTQFQLDCMKEMRVNDGKMSKAMFNLLVTKRDTQMYLRGMKPHRGWQIGQVKAYFGVNGNKQKVADKIQELYDFVTEEAGKMVDEKTGSKISQ